MPVIVQKPTAAVGPASLLTPPPSPTLQAFDLAARLKGQTIRLPNLKQHLVGWPTSTSEYLPEVRIVVDEMLEAITENPKKLRAIKACDFGFLVSSAFAGTSWEGIQAAALFLVWIFVWDDEIDHGEGEGGASSDSALAKAYCQESIDYIKWALGLSESSVEPACDISNMALFKELSQSLIDGMDLVQRQRMFNELYHYIQQCLVEQTQQQNGSVPTPEAYTTMRLGTSGITPGLAFCEFTAGVKLPTELMESVEMRQLWKEATTLCMMINDMYSMKKEVKSGALQNMIPVMINASPATSLDDIMAEFAGLFSRSVASFNVSYSILDERTRHDAELNNDLREYVKGCQAIVTGLLEWSLMTKRYQIKDFLQADGSAIAQL